MTKKIVALLLIAVLLLALPACKEEPQSSHLDWVFTPDPPNTGALTEEGYYYRADEVLNYADIATGTSVVLCAKPGCKHGYSAEDEAPCDAYMPLSGKRILLENDTLYYCGNQNVLCSRDATGGSLKELGVLAKELIEERKYIGMCIHAICNGYLYYSAIIRDVDQNASGATYTTAGDCIGRFDLAKRKDELLIVQDQVKYYEKIQLIAARETGILYLHWEGLGPEQDWEKVDAKTLRDALRKMPVQVKHLDLATGETTVVLSTVYGTTSGVRTVENGKLYYTKSIDGMKESHSYDLTTGKDTIVYQTDDSTNYYGKGYCLRYRYADPNDPQTVEIWIYDMNTEKMLPCTLSGNFWAINRSANGMVMYYNNRSTHDGYYFVSYDSLADGLQETDLKFLYTNS